MLETFEVIVGMLITNQCVVVVEPFIYFAFLFFHETVITRAQGPVVVIAKKKKSTDIS